MLVKRSKRSTVERESRLEDSCCKSVNNSTPDVATGIEELMVSKDDDFVDQLMMKAYGEKLIKSGGHDLLDFWFGLWRKVVSFNGVHYDIPGGPIGRRYVDMLSDEVQQLSAGKITLLIAWLCFLHCCCREKKV